MVKSRRQRNVKRKRQTRRQKQRGGADAKRLTANIKKAVALSKPEAGQKYGSANLYYSPINLEEANAMIIGAHIGGTSKESIKNASYPFEECILLFHFKMPNDYPAVPPKVLHMTPGILGTPGRYRIHPNLYEIYRGNSGYSRKTCLGILGTWGANEWVSTMGPAEVLQGISGILEKDPGTYEPGYDKLLSGKTIEGKMYNLHTFAECLEITCAIYKAVVKAIPVDATSNSISDTNINRASIPSELAPFVEPLALRAYSALGFLIGKLDEFIRLNNKSILYLDDTTHKAHRYVDFGELKQCLEDVRNSIPPGLQKNIFSYGLGEIHRALYNLSKPKRANGTRLTYQECVEEMEEQKRQEKEKEKKEAAAKAARNAAALAARAARNAAERAAFEIKANAIAAALAADAASASAAVSNENETEYVYNNANQYKNLNQNKNENQNKNKNKNEGKSNN